MPKEKKMIKCAVCGQDIAKNAKVCPSCGGKIKKPFYKKAWFYVLIGIIVVIVAASSGNSNSTDSPATSTEEKEIEYTVYEVSELVDDLENNALNAEEKYNGQYVEITGKLSVIDSSGDYISLNPTDNDFSFTNVQCYIKNDEQKSKIVSLSKGDLVTVKGKIKSVGEVLGYSLDIDSIN